MTDRELMQEVLEALQAVREAPASKDEIQRAWIVSDLLRRRLAQPDREWVGLTDEEIKTLPQWFPSHESAAVMPLIRAFEAKLREKNT
jgi:hypothetical protein